MTPNPHDLLADGFPHGTLEGERAGCSTSVCPGTPLTCTEVASSYRTDIKFKRLYTTGLRGQELLDVYREGRPAGPERAPRAAKPSPVAAPAAADFDSLDQDAQYRQLLEWREQGLAPAAIGNLIGKSAPSVGRMLTAASRRLDEVRDEVQGARPAPDTLAPEAGEPAPGPVPAATAVARFGVPPMEIDDIPGPQLVRAWVVVDREKRVIGAFANPEEAVPALAEAWRRDMAIDGGAGS